MPAEAETAAASGPAASSDLAAEEAEGRDYTSFTEERHAREKGMMGGVMRRTALRHLQGLHAAPDGALRLEKIGADQTPAFLKIIDEVVTNATDHFREHAKAPRAADRVRAISLDFAPDTGRVEVYNDGPGLPIVVHAAASEQAGRAVYVPELAFGKVFAGRNMEKAPDCVKGGINGVGAKLPNLHSLRFQVETARNRKTYRQQWSDEMRVCGEPEIGHQPGRTDKGFTRVTFTPNYPKLDYRPDASGAPLTAEDAANLSAWMRWRMARAAAYVGPTATVRYNGAVLTTTSAAALARLVAAAAAPGGENAQLFPLTVKGTAPPYSDHAWDVAAAVLPEPPAGRARNPPCSHVSVINGVCCSKGSHVAWLKKLVADAVTRRVAKATRAKVKEVPADEACRGLVLAFAAPIPGADWDGQQKDELHMGIKVLQSGYSVAAAPLTKLAEALAERLLHGADRKKPPPANLSAIAKYSGARRAGTKDAKSCRLLLAEGDSAVSFLRAILGEGRRCGGATCENYGTFSLGGVPMNAVKESWWEAGPAAAKARGAAKARPVPEKSAAPSQGPAPGPRLCLSDKLRKNQTFADLNAILGLDFEQTYRTAADRARLRYGGVAVCTDQDLDGTGKILPLVLAYFWRFWPELIEAGYLLRLESPVIRVYPQGKKPPLAFHYEAEYAEWAASAAPKDLGAVKYYKGLGSHSAAEVAAMARTFEGDLHSFELDGGAGALFEGYYADPTEFRKQALSRPVKYPSAAEMAAAREARRRTCSQQLDVDALAYKQDTLQRNLPGLDGLPVSRRKILAGAFAHFGKKAQEVKVYQLGGSVAQHMCYHHGDASLCGTITQMAQRFPGALRYPLLVGAGQFGTRHFKGKDHASPRYVSVRLAPWARAAFPAADDCLLPHVSEDGERAQPVCYAPVLPTVLLETYSSIAEGWSVNVVARDLGQVVALLRAYLAGDPDVARAAAGGAVPDALRERFPLDPSLEGYGELLEPEDRAALLRRHRGQLASFGHYENLVSDGGARRLRVTELPMGVSTAEFLETLQKGDRPGLIARTDDQSYGPHVDVALTLAEGAWEKILAGFGEDAADPVEDCFRLHRPLRSQLNLHTPDGSMRAFGGDYHAVFFHWLPLRKDLYEARLRREAVLLGLRLRLEKETLRYLESGLRLGAEPDEERASALLAEQGYPRLDAGFLGAPGHAPTDRLAALAAGPGASLDYVLSLRERDHVAAARSRRSAGIRTKEERLAEVERLLAEKPFAGASVWSAEVDRALAAIEQGRQNGWWAR